MTRSQLARFDSGLYHSLCKLDQLKKVIPVIGNRLSELDIKQILDSHETSKGIPFRAAKIINFGNHTIKKYWSKYDLEIFPKIDHEKIVNSYDLYNGIASKVAKFLGCSTTTVLFHWRQEGLSIRKPKYQRDIEYDYSYYGSLKEKRRKEILPLYEKFNGNAKRAYNNSPYSYETICNYWKEAGFIPRGHKERRPFRKIGPRLSQQEIQKIIDTFKENRGNVSKTARDTKFSKQTVTKYCKEAKLSIIRGGNKKRDLWEDDPVTYFLEHYLLERLSRTELRHVNGKLYKKLESMGVLDELIPSQLGKYRGYESPIKYFQEHKELHKLFRSQLAIKDNGLYVSLLRHGQMDKAIPYKFLLQED